MKNLAIIFSILGFIVLSLGCSKKQFTINSESSTNPPTLNNPNIRICMLGDSETRRINHYWGIDTNWNSLTGIDSIFNYGFDAFQTSHTLNYTMFLAMDKNPDIIFLMIGINDAHQSVPLSTTLSNVRSIIDTIQGRQIDLVIQSVLPTTNYYDTLWGGFSQNGILAARSKIMNDSLRQICIQRTVPFLDLRSGLVTSPINRSGVTYLLNSKSIDGIHLNYSGYEVWRDHLMNWLITNGY